MKRSIVLLLIATTFSFSAYGQKLSNQATNPKSTSTVNFVDFDVPSEKAICIEKTSGKWVAQVESCSQCNPGLTTCASFKLSKSGSSEAGQQSRMTRTTLKLKRPELQKMIDGVIWKGENTGVYARFYCQIENPGNIWEVPSCSACAGTCYEVKIGTSGSNAGKKN